MDASCTLQIDIQIIKLTIPRYLFLSTNYFFYFSIIFPFELQCTNVINNTAVVKINTYKALFQSEISLIYPNNGGNIAASKYPPDWAKPEISAASLSFLDFTENKYITYENDPPPAKAKIMINVNINTKFPLVYSIPTNDTKYPIVITTGIINLLCTLSAKIGTINVDGNCAN